VRDVVEDERESVVLVGREGEGSCVRTRSMREERKRSQK